jgi:alkyl hydroperoxide reductase subunit AhpC
MSQLTRAYSRITEAGAEILEVTTSTPARARFYARQFALRFPYLCDPDHRVHDAWGIVKRPHGVGYYAKTLIGAMRSEIPPNDYGAFKPALSEMPATLADEDMGVFVVDRAGAVRYALAGSYFSPGGPRAIPGPDELVREVQRCAAVA